MSTPSVPPRRLRRLLEAILPETVAGRSALGDLLEEYSRRPQGWRRVFWLAFVAGDVVVQYLPSRFASLLAGFGRDLRHAARLSRRHPAPVVGGVLSLSLAIGGTTAVFTIANSLWLRARLGVDPSVVKMWRRNATGGSLAWPQSEFSQVRELARPLAVEGVVVTTEPVGALGEAGLAEAATVGLVTGSYFPVLHARSALGRLITAEDDRPGAEPVVVLDHLYWRRHFSGDRGVLGRRVRIGAAKFTVVGIAGRDFVDPSGRQPMLWTPLASLASVASPKSGSPPRPFVIVRLPPGLTLAEANVRLSNLLPRLVPAAGVARLTGIEVVPTLSGAEVALDQDILGGVLLVIALVLVLACTNVSNLQLASVLSRRQEIAVRLSSGASPRRVVRQIITESALLCAASAALGVLLARTLTPLLATNLGLSQVDVDPDGRVYAFAVVAAVAAAVGTALAPASYGARTDIALSLRGLGPGRAGQSRPGRTRSILVGIQAAASVVVVVLASLQIRALVHLAWMDPGFDVDRLLTVSSPRRGGPSDAHGPRFWPEALARLRALPGVEHASLAMFAPFAVHFGNPDNVIDNDTDADYFATVGLRVTRGRSYSAAEVAAHQAVAVISQQLADRYWGHEDPIGTSMGRVDPNFGALRVIGVADDALVDRVHGRRTPMVYEPYDEAAADGDAALVVRAANPAALAGPVREALRAIAPDQTVSVAVVEDAYRREFEQPRRYAALAATIAIFALALSVVGLFGVTTYAVRARTAEIGVRMALGAQRAQIVGPLMRESLRPVLAGLAAGLGLALLAGQAAAGLLFGLSGRDPLALACAIAVLMASAAVAVAVPIRRAAALDPTVVLRSR